MPTLGSENRFPLVRLLTDDPPSAAPAGQVHLYADTDKLAYQIDEDGTITALAGGGGGGDVATDAIWDAAGDLAVGSGADTAARLAKGAEGSALTVMDGVVGWNGATSMPGSPTTGQRVWRSDLALECYYDGTRWLSTTLYFMPMSGPFDGQTTAAQNGYPIPATFGTTVLSRLSLWNDDFEPWLVKLYGETYTNATNNGSHYWIFSLSGAVTATAYGNFTTAADTAGVHTGHETALNVAAGSTERGLILTQTRTGTPGTSYCPTSVSYRLIVT